MIDPDITLQGITSAGAGGVRLQQYYKHGCFAQQIMVPTENAVRIGSIEEADAGNWSALGLLAVPYGGLLAVDLQAGETVLINGATGTFGSAGVMVALAMGAGCVLAAGRNEKILADLVKRFGSRVKAVILSGEEQEDTKRMKEAAGPIDVVLDLLPPAAPATVARAAVMAVRQYGRVVLMGGVGMGGGPGLELSYPWLMRNSITVRGQWMYPPSATQRLAAMVHSGQIDLKQYDVRAFPLDEANEAVAYSAAHGGQFNLIVLKP